MVLPDTSRGGRRRWDPHHLPFCTHQTCRTQGRNHLLFAVRSSVGLCEPSLDQISHNCHGSTWDVHRYWQIDKKWLFLSKPYKKLLLINHYSQRPSLMLTSHLIPGYLWQLQSVTNCSDMDMPAPPNTQNWQSFNSLSKHFQTSHTLLWNSPLLSTVLVSLMCFSVYTSWLVCNSTHVNNTAYDFPVQNQSKQKMEKTVLSRDIFLHSINKIIGI